MFKLFASSPSSAGSVGFGEGSFNSVSPAVTVRRTDPSSIPAPPRRVSSGAPVDVNRVAASPTSVSAFLESLSKGVGSVLGSSWSRTGVSEHYTQVLPTNISPYLTTSGETLEPRALRVLVLQDTGDKSKLPLLDTSAIDLACRPASPQLPSGPTSFQSAPSSMSNQSLLQFQQQQVSDRRADPQAVPRSRHSRTGSDLNEQTSMSSSSQAGSYGRAGNMYVNQGRGFSQYGNSFGGPIMEVSASNGSGQPIPLVSNSAMFNRFTSGSARPAPGAGGSSFGMSSVHSSASGSSRKKSQHFDLLADMMFGVAPPLASQMVVTKLHHFKAAYPQLLVTKLFSFSVEVSEDDAGKGTDSGTLYERQTNTTEITNAPQHRFNQVAFQIGSDHDRSSSMSSSRSGIWSDNENGSAPNMSDDRNAFPPVVPLPAGATKAIAIQTKSRVGAKPGQDDDYSRNAQNWSLQQMQSSSPTPSNMSGYSQLSTSDNGNGGISAILGSSASSSYLLNYKRKKMNRFSLNDVTVHDGTDADSPNGLLSGTASTGAMSNRSQTGSGSTYTLLSTVKVRKRRKIMYSVGLLVDVMALPFLRDFFFTHYSLIDNHLEKLQKVIAESIARLLQAQARAMAVLAMEDGNERTVNFPDGFTNAYALQNEPVIVAEVERFRSTLCNLFNTPRIKEPLWLNMSTFPTRRPACSRQLLSDLVGLIENHNTKDKNFFLSSLLTEVLTQHLAWTATVASYTKPSITTQSDDATEVQHASPYNLYMAQLNDLYGAVGCPPAITKTLVVGARAPGGSNSFSAPRLFTRLSGSFAPGPTPIPTPRGGNQTVNTPDLEDDVMQRVLRVLTYFVRCGELTENIQTMRAEEGETLLGGNIDLGGQNRISIASSNDDVQGEVQVLEPQSPTTIPMLTVQSADYENVDIVGTSVGRTLPDPDLDAPIESAFQSTQPMGVPISLSFSSSVSTTSSKSMSPGQASVSSTADNDASTSSPTDKRADPNPLTAAAPVRSTPPLHYLSPGRSLLGGVSNVYAPDFAVLGLDAGVGSSSETVGITVTPSARRSDSNRLGRSPSDGMVSVPSWIWDGMCGDLHQSAEVDF
ncbi:folliculin-interacting protein middle domain-containing protein [Cladochytrium replicatum]|nr:folliculin-interacting protein middle domain-containing protein [Cladochytrium replicatum]